MKKIFLLFAAVALMSSTIFVEKEEIIDTKWYLKDQESTAIYFKHDNTFWHYTSDPRADSAMLCYWNMDKDRVYLSCTNISTKNKDTNNLFVQSFQILFCDNNKLIIRDTRNYQCTEYCKIK